MDHLALDSISQQLALCTSVTEMKGHWHSLAMLRNLGSIPQAVGAIEEFSIGERDTLQFVF